jgi:hypothetical protein
MHQAADLSFEVLFRVDPPPLSLSPLLLRAGTHTAHFSLHLHIAVVLSHPLLWSPPGPSGKDFIVLRTIPELPDSLLVTGAALIQRFLEIFDFITTCSPLLPLCAATAWLRHMPINGFIQTVDPRYVPREQQTHRQFASRPTFVLVPSQSQASETCQQTVLNPEARGRDIEPFICSSHVGRCPAFFGNWSHTRRHQMR